jgi:hypothetical protein
LPAVASTLLMPGCAGSVETSGVNMMRTATVPSIFAHSSIVSPTLGSLESTGLIRAKRLGNCLCTETA